MTEPEEESSKYHSDMEKIMNRLGSVEEAREPGIDRFARYLGTGFTLLSVVGTVVYIVIFTILFGGFLLQQR